MKDEALNPDDVPLDDPNAEKLRRQRWGPIPPSRGDRNSLQFE